jgi:hypothetical protein
VATISIAIPISIPIQQTILVAKSFYFPKFPSFSTSPRVWPSASTESVFEINVMRGTEGDQHLARHLELSLVLTADRH